MRECVGVAWRAWRAEPPRTDPHITQVVDTHTAPLTRDDLLRNLLAWDLVGLGVGVGVSLYEEDLGRQSNTLLLAHTLHTHTHTAHTRTH